MQSQSVALADLSDVEAIVEQAEPFIHGEGPGINGHTFLPAGMLCHTGSDGQFDWAAYLGGDGRVHGFDLYFDEPDPGQPAWVLAGYLPTLTGLAIIGDPSLLAHYAQDPLTGPLTATQLWDILVLPGPGRLAIHLLENPNPHLDANIALRTTWEP